MSLVQAFWCKTCLFQSVNSRCLAFRFPGNGPRDSSSSLQVQNKQKEIDFKISGLAIESVHLLNFWKTEKPSTPLSDTRDLAWLQNDFSYSSGRELASGVAILG